MVLDLRFYWEMGKVVGIMEWESQARSTRWVVGDGHNAQSWGPHMGNVRVVISLLRYHLCELPFFLPIHFRWAYVVPAVNYLSEAASFPLVELKYDPVTTVTDVFVFVLQWRVYVFSPASEQMPKFVSSAWREEKCARKLMWLEQVMSHLQYTAINWSY